MPPKRVSRANTIRWLRNPLYSDGFKLRDEFREGFAILHDFERNLKLRKPSIAISNILNTGYSVKKINPKIKTVFFDGEGFQTEESAHYLIFKKHPETILASMITKINCIILIDTLLKLKRQEISFNFSLFLVSINF